MSIWALQKENAKIEFKMLRDISGNVYGGKGGEKRGVGRVADSDVSLTLV